MGPDLAGDGHDRASEEIRSEIERLAAKVAASRQRPSVYTRLAELLDSIGNRAEAERVIDAGSKWYKHSTYLTAQAGVLAYRDQKYDLALSLLSDVVYTASEKGIKLPRLYLETHHTVSTRSEQLLLSLIEQRDWRAALKMLDALRRVFNRAEKSLPKWLPRRERQVCLFLSEFYSANKKKKAARQLVERANSEITPKLSIVIPVYQVEDYLAECLESVEAQIFDDYEVVMVDDGSQDNSVNIAYAWVVKDDRFRVVHQENGGLGHARNTGTTRAYGKYLIFLDSDDTVPADAYSTMVDTIEKTGSDFVSGRIMRFNDKKWWVARSSQKVHFEKKLGTHVSQFRNLYIDLTAWNKLFRRDFYERHRIEFPRDRLYEDMPTITPAHFLASKVDVIDTVVYNWRRRDKGASISQSKHVDQQHFTDRMKGVRSVVDFISEYPDISLVEDYRVHALEEDILYFINIIGDAEPQYQEVIKSGASAFYRESSERVRSRLASVVKLKYQALALPDLDQTISALRKISDESYRRRPYQIEGSKVYYRLEEADSVLVAPVEEELKVTSRVTSLDIDDESLSISGFAYIDCIEMSDVGDGDVQVWFEGSGLAKGVVTRSVEPQATQQSKQEFVNYEASGFLAKIPVSEFLTTDAVGSAEWTAKVLVAKGGVYKVADLLARAPGTEITLSHNLEDGRTLRLFWDASDKLIVQVSPAVPQLVTARMEEQHLVVHVASSSMGQGGFVQLRHETTKKTFRAETDADTGRFRVALDAIWKSFVAGKEVGWLIEYGDSIWKPQRLLVPLDASIAGGYCGDVELVVRRDRYGYARLLVRSVQPRLTKIGLSDDGKLSVSIRYPAATGAEKFVLKAKNHVETVRSDLVKGDDGLLSAVVCLSQRGVFGNLLPLKNGRWEALVATQDGETALQIEASVVRNLPLDVTIRQRQYRVTTQSWHRINVEVSSDVLPKERGKYYQTVLRSEYYPSIKKELLDQFLFISYNGQQFSDSPRMIFERLRELEGSRRCLLVVRDQKVPVPDGIESVIMWSREYYDALARSKWVVTNQHLPDYFEKREGQVVLQTWHGIGLKKVGVDIEQVAFPNKMYHEQVRREAKKWDYLISPNSFNSPIMRRAFEYSGELLETGIPRNDIFFRQDAGALAQQVRSRLGIPEDKRVVLYAPTWRDNVHTARGVYKLDLNIDLGALARRLGEEFIVLMRTHANVVDGIDVSGCESLLLDVSYYNDMQELLLCSDILITDYSTSMFDFANTNRPMIFFPYDLEKYRDELRGFYFDYEAEIPGRIVRDEESVFRAILRSAEDRMRFDGKYKAFQSRFCEWDDGRAADRVIRTVFGLGSEKSRRRSRRQNGIDDESDRHI